MSAAADLVLRGAAVFTGTRPHPTATTVAVTDGRITAVGTDEQVRAVVGRARETVRVPGGMILPGFTDAHVHPIMGGVELDQCDLSGCADETSTIAAVAAYAAARPRSPWILGGGWQSHHFPAGAPTRGQLDAVVPDRPAFLLDAAHHSAWVNSAALELAGVGAGTPDPANGRIDRAPDGTPSGLLHERARALVEKLVPATSDVDAAAGLARAQRYLHSFGITGWQDAIVGAYGGHPDHGGVYAEAAARGTLTARVVGALWWPPETSAAEIGDRVDELVRRRAALSGGRFRADAVKIMQDGVAETCTAAMLTPYAGACGCGATGLSHLPSELLGEVVTRLDAAGFAVHVHAIGDRAVREALDAFARARARNGRTGNRHHLAHLQLVHDTDLPRFAGLGVAANLQAVWACRDTEMLSTTFPVLGAERAQRQFPFGALHRSGARLALGSDWPVSTPDVVAAIHVAVNRRPPGDPAAAPLGEGQELELTTALRAGTVGSAWLNGRDDCRVRAGAPADLTVLDRDPFTVPAEELYLVRAALTVANGQVVHHR
ncbi:amidohydrolase [Amycolatopsis taiwanensis]|uniref:amidohydrolase n=1 Tax=Amycolatopsis taiwanensis TaxID=342230 RepID=UPI000481C7B0|nr:amidohydrolase [Amycolatopsis taiwanensis]